MDPLLGGNEASEPERTGARELIPEGDPEERRVRDVAPTAAQWRIGGGSGAVNQTRILDAAWPDAGVQKEMLSGYPAATGSIDNLTPDDFWRVPLLVAD